MKYISKGSRIILKVKLTLSGSISLPITLISKYPFRMRFPFDSEGTVKIIEIGSKQGISSLTDIKGIIFLNFHLYSLDQILFYKIKFYLQMNLSYK